MITETESPRKLTRLPGWEKRLREWMAEVRDKPFAWGEHDCCLAAADCVCSLTGHDPAEFFRGRYLDASGAVRALAASGFSSVEEATSSIAAECGMRMVPVTMACRGDLLLFDERSFSRSGFRLGGMLGVCIGRLAAIPGALGLELHLTLCAKLGWTY